MSTGAHNMVKEDIESDIQIGAVEVKDHFNDTRQSVGADGVAYAPAENGAAIGGTDPATGLFRTVTTALSAGRRGLDTNVVSAPGGANRTTFSPGQVTIVVANTPVQLPNIAIPNGFALTVRNSDANPAARIVFVADSAANALLAASRYRLVVTETISLRLTNANLVFVNSANAGVLVDFIVET
jgi:hypothetical protein